LEIVAFIIGIKESSYFDALGLNMKPQERQCRPNDNKDSISHLDYTKAVDEWNLNFAWCPAV